MNNQDQFTPYSDIQMIEIWEQIEGSLRYTSNAFLIGDRALPRLNSCRAIALMSGYLHTPIHISS